MTLVYESNEIVREIVDQAERPFSGRASVKISGVVLDSGAIAHFFDHFEIILHALLQALRFERLSDALEVIYLFYQVVLDHAYGLDCLLLRRHEVLGRVDRDLVEVLNDRSRNWVYQGYSVDFISEELYPYGFIGTSEEYVYRVAPDTESSALEICLSAAVQSVDKMVHQPCHAALLAFADRHGLGMEVGRIAYAIQAGHAGDDDDIPAPGHQGRSGAQPELVDLVVDAEVFLYIGICRRNICLRLVIIVI